MTVSGNSQFALLGQRRFAPLFATQFMGAFHDNLFKNALVVMLLYTAVFSTAADPKLLTTMAAALFILPFVLFSAIGGQLADKMPKDRLIRIIKLTELPIAALGAAALMTGSLGLAFMALFALGAQSAFFGPCKYSILPQHLRDDELVGGNALLNTGSFLAILAGTLAGAALAVVGGGQAGAALVGVVLVASAAVGYVAARFVPATAAAAPDIEVKWNPLHETVRILRDTLARPRATVLAILGVGWFYFLGGMFMAQFPNYTRETLGAGQDVLTFFLIVFSVGIAAGGLLNARLLKGRVEAVYVPLAILGITVFAVDLYFANGAVVAGGGDMGLGAFLSYAAHWRVVVDVAMIALCGGLFVVPLNAIIQHTTPAAIRARIVAGGAIINALFIVASAALSAVLIALGWDMRDLFMAFAVANIGVALYICRILPDYLFKSALQIVLKTLYKVEVRGLENVALAGPRAVVVGNHVSLLDPPLLAAFLPGRPMFAVNSHVANWWWVKPFLRLVDAFPLDPTNPFSMKTLIRKVEEDRHVVIFPEGRLTETGALMKIYEGPGMIADKAEAMILPVRLDGVQHTKFARLKGRVPLRSFPKITITILPPRKFRIDPALRGRTRRAVAARQLYDLMEEMMFLTADREQTLFNALLKAEHVNGPGAVICEDITRKPMKFRQLVRGAIVLGRKIEARTARGENVGVLLPNANAAVATFFALQAYGRVPAMMNFSAGAAALLSAVKTAQIKTVLSSRRFIEMGRLQDVVAAIAEHAEIVYLEDVKAQVTVADKVRGLLASPSRVHARADVAPHDPAVVLFTSGSEGEPKGVVLSHANLMTNIVQLSCRVDFNRQDIVFNCLPMFHSFGLTGGTLLPVLSGVRTFFYPSPLHYRIVPELVYSSNATIMFGTDTFLNGYARMASAYDFYRMRYIFAGAEKVKDETRQTYMSRFGVRILEGYGATETAPVIAVNSPMHQKPGTVGRFLAGVGHRLEPVPGVTDGQRLFVRGPNVMLGYYLPDRPGVLRPPAEGWHDTGDIVAIDGDGFVAIRGRAKRFAKIAGEMVSLTQAETLAAATWPDAVHAVVALPDPRKGEQLVLLTTQVGAERGSMSAQATQRGITALAVPAHIVVVDKVPVLGSGKTDYVAVKMLAEEKRRAG